MWVGVVRVPLTRPGEILIHHLLATCSTHTQALACGLPRHPDLLNEAIPSALTAAVALGGLNMLQAFDSKNPGASEGVRAALQMLLNSGCVFVGERTDIIAKHFLTRHNNPSIHPIHPLTAPSRGHRS